MHAYPTPTPMSTSERLSRHIILRFTTILPNEGISKGDPQNSGICPTGHFCSLLQSNGDLYLFAEWSGRPFSGKVETNVGKLYRSPDIHLTNQKPPRGPPLFSLPTHAWASLISLSTQADK